MLSSGPSHQADPSSSKQTINGSSTSSDSSTLQPSPQDPSVKPPPSPRHSPSDRPPAAKPQVIQTDETSVAQEIAQAAAGTPSTGVVRSLIVSTRVAADGIREVPRRFECCEVEDLIELIGESGLPLSLSACLPIRSSRKGLENCRKSGRRLVRPSVSCSNENGRDNG